MTYKPKAYSPEYLDEMINWGKQCTNNPKTCCNKYFCICESVDDTTTAERIEGIKQEEKEEVDRRWDRLGCPVHSALVQEGIE